MNYAPPGGWEKAAERPPEKLFKTHCSFCGMQCDIQLKVRDNLVTGFEPWEEFPFNKGMLCPKGVKRYLQGADPDRLLSPLMRTDGGFRPVAYAEALDYTARRLTEIKEKYSPNAIAIYSGASVALPGFLSSGVLFLACLGMYRLVAGLDRSPEPEEEPHGLGPWDIR